jgi:glucose-1-phosphate thymidylyltransferase
MGPAASFGSKQLLPVFDKPLICYPLSTLMLAGIRDILVIVRPDELEVISNFLGDGSDFGISLSYAQQDEPRGIAEALVIADDFLDGSRSCLILGDNVLIGSGLGTSLRQLASEDTASILGYSMVDPTAYAVATVGTNGQVTALVEKPATTRPGLAVPGIYFFPPDASSLARSLVPSHRGELEITDLNCQYLDQGRLRIRTLPRSAYWMDAGTPERLLDAGNFVRTLSEREGAVIACPEDIAFAAHWIDVGTLAKRAHRFGRSRYGQYLMRLLGDESR